VEAIAAPDEPVSVDEPRVEAPEGEPTVAEDIPEAPVEEPTAEQPPADEPSAEEPPAGEPSAEEPSAEEPSAEEPSAEEPESSPSGPPDLSTGRDQARLAAAIERVGGPAAIREALQPKRDESGKPLKWAAVCCEASQGLKPGDPVFAAWVRLAATPVRELKARVPDERPERGRGGRGGGGRGRDDRGGGPRGGRRDDRDGGGRATREDMQKHAFGGHVGAKIVIPGFEPPTDEE
jgi:hypothetical protein